MGRRRGMKGKTWIWLTLCCILFWALVIRMLFLAIHADAATPEEGLEQIIEGLDLSEEDLTMTPEEIAEEEYYDSLEMLAVCVEAEAGNQSLDGKRMVVDVILNRVDDPDWPDTITEVISQPYEFSSYWDGGMERVWAPSEETYEAVRMELEERSWPGIYYFTAGRYSEYGTPWKKAGDHYFSTK